MEDDDYGPFLYDIHDLWRHYGVSLYVHERVRRAVNKAAREARAEALAEVQRVLDAYNPERDDFSLIISDNETTRAAGSAGEDLTQHWIKEQRAKLRRSLRPKPDGETKRAQNRERVRRFRERERAR
jgi:hypothetical protein